MPMSRRPSEIPAVIGGLQLQKQNLPTRVIQAWLGHADIRHTVRYTELSSVPFKDLKCTNS